VAVSYVDSVNITAAFDICKRHIDNDNFVMGDFARLPRTSPPMTERPYHHGNLRQTLIDEGLAML
jgi:hypothetical protein